LWFLFTFVFISDEQRIFRIIEKSKHKFESGSLLYFPTIISENYRGRIGADRSELLGIIKLIFQETKSRDVKIIQYNISVTDETAQVSIEYQLSFSGQSSHLPNTKHSANMTRDVLHLDLQKSNHSWEIVEIHR